VSTERLEGAFAREFVLNEGVDESPRWRFTASPEGSL
jgi:hypothetical protein